MSTIDTGKRGELLVLGELLKRGARVYTPLVDAKGVDVAVRCSDGNYIELQVKTVATPKDPRWFQVTDIEPRPNLYIVAYRCPSGKFGLSRPRYLLNMLPSHKRSAGQRFTTSI